MDIRQFSDAVIKGVTGGGPSSAFGLESYFNNPIQRQGQIQAGNNLSRAARLKADNEEKQRKAAAEQQRAKAEFFSDPRNYQKLRKDDGGFAFFDPEGKEIDIDTYAKKTGMRRVDILKDSENPIDQQYISDWSKMNELSQAMYSGDRATISAVEQKYPQMFAGGITPESMMRELVKRYPHIYGVGSYEETWRNRGKPVFQLDVADPLGLNQLGSASSQAGF